MGHGASFFFHTILALFAIVTHLLYIAPSWDIRLRREPPSVTILTHSEDIRWYHPLECIAIHLSEPSIHIMRIISHEEGIVPDDHESFYVVWVVFFLYAFYNGIHTIHTSDFWKTANFFVSIRLFLLIYTRVNSLQKIFTSSNFFFLRNPNQWSILSSLIIPPAFWKFFSMIQHILSIDIIVMIEIELPHILSPSEDLSDESLHARKWGMPSESGFDDFEWREKSKIDRRREHRVMYSHILLIHRIFESAEVSIVIFEEIPEEWECIGSRYWEWERYIWNIIVFFCLIEILSIFRFPFPARYMMLVERSILTIIIPLSSYWLSICLHEDIATFSHISVEYLHDRWFLELFSKFFWIDKKLPIRKYLEWYSWEYIFFYLSREILLTRTHGDDICDPCFCYELFDTFSVAYRFEPVSPIS